MAEFRRDPVIGRWVIIDSGRNFSQDVAHSAPEDHDPKNCPFCAGNEAVAKNEIYSVRNDADKSKWSLRVIPNNKPILKVEGSLGREACGMYDRMNGIGAHEIVIETPDHYQKPHELEVKQIANIFTAFKNRMNDLKRDTRLEYILLFKNYGKHTNTKNLHNHSQLIATPIIPKRVWEEILGAKKFFEYKERCVFCDMISQETSLGLRTVFENEKFLAFCPYASRYPFEMCVLPKKHSSDFVSLSDADALSLAEVMQFVYKRLFEILDNPSFSFLVHSAPLKNSNLEHYHWHIEVIPKLTHTSGFEWGTGLYINPVLPEEAAKFLREEK
jgi:UDPglucose--hexose-1-phosphate uridylyltransferase